MAGQKPAKNFPIFLLIFLRFFDSIKLILILFSRDKQHLIVLLTTFPQHVNMFSNSDVINQNNYIEQNNYVSTFNLVPKNDLKSIKSLLDLPQSAVSLDNVNRYNYSLLQDDSRREQQMHVLYEIQVDSSLQWKSEPVSQCELHALTCHNYFYIRDNYFFICCWNPATRPAIIADAHNRSNAMQRCRQTLPRRENITKRCQKCIYSIKF